MASITLKQALVGMTLSIPTIDKIVIPYKLSGMTTPKTEVRILDHGMQISNTPGQYGDLIVRFNIEFLSELPPKNKQNCLISFLKYFRLTVICCMLCDHLHLPVKV